MELCVIEGDGIGREVIPAAVRVLRATLPDLNIQPAAAGWDHFNQTGEPLPQATLELARECGAVLYGAANSPSYPVEGYFNPIVRLRRLLYTHASLRPVISLPVQTARPGVDLLVVREVTEDVYQGEEVQSDEGMTGSTQKIITRAASERIAHTAFELARQNKRRLVTIVHKGNVMPRTDGLFRRACFDVAQQYPEIEVDELLVDTAAYWMVKEPARFDIILTLNLYGDILSDMAAAWGGGIGLAPTLDLGADFAIAEPVHGSAPDLVGRGIANPTAAILSSAMLVRYHWKLPEVANRIETAIYRTLASGVGTPDVRADNSVSTAEFTEYVLGHLQAII